MVAVVLQIGYCEHHDEDHVERIMRERDLRQPHEVKSKYKESRVGDEDHQNSGNLHKENMEIRNLKSELQNCISSNNALQKSFVESVTNESTYIGVKEMPYLKRIYRGILSIWKKSNGSTEKIIKFKFTNTSLGNFDKCVDGEEHVEDCMDAIIAVLGTWEEDIPTKYVDHIAWIIDRVDLNILSYAAISLAIFVLIVYTARCLIASRHTILGLMFILVCVSFIASIPWEWMRLYKEALARKVATKMTAPSDCFQEKMSYLSLVKYWLQDTFSFSDNECIKYYNAEIVDPIYEVTPGQAVAAAASRILFHPMLVLSEHVGKCFKLIFSEVPVQWQPFVFIAIFLLVLLFLGIEISGPLMQIGKHGQVKGQLDAERQKNRELKSEIDKLHRRLELTGQNAERAVDYQPGI